MSVDNVSMSSEDVHIASESEHEVAGKRKCSDKAYVEIQESAADAPSLLALAASLGVPAALVAREALRQRGETRREELRQNGETVRTALTGKLPDARQLQPPAEEEGHADTPNSDSGRNE